MRTDVTAAADKATAERRALLGSYEQQIEQHAGEIDAHRIAGRQALAEIHRRDLWRDAGHKSWAAYCAERWGIGKSTAYELVQWANDQLRAIEAGEPVPSARQARAARKEASPRARTRPVTPPDAPSPYVRTDRPVEAPEPATTPVAPPPVKPAAAPAPRGDDGRVECPRCHGEGTIPKPSTTATATGHCVCAKRDPTPYGLCKTCGLPR